MKKHFFSYSISSLVLLVLLINPSVFGQTIPKFGLKGGLNFSTFVQTDIDAYEYKPGVLVGAFLEVSIPQTNVSFQPEITYIQYGANVDEGDISLNMNYIQLPLLLKISGNTPAVKPNFLFGPYANFLVSSEIDGDGGSLDFDDVTKNSAFGFLIGAGIEANKIRAGIQLTAGLSEVFEDVFNDGEKNFGIALTLGVTL